MKTKKQDTKVLLDKHFADDDKRFGELHDVIFGNPDHNEVGMKVKLDEIHEMLTQLKGWKALLGILILIGGALMAIKGITTFFK